MVLTEGAALEALAVQVREDLSTFKLYAPFGSKAFCIEYAKRLRNALQEGVPEEVDAPEEEEVVRTVRYGSFSAEVTSANGATGFIMKSFDEKGIRFFFRVYHEDHEFTDYDLRHDDLEVTISSAALASFYQLGEHRILDHDPEVLGLRSLIKDQPVPDPEPELKAWYFTFPVTLPRWGIFWTKNKDSHHYVRIEAKSAEEAYKKMVNARGEPGEKTWATQYSEERFKEWPAKLKLTEIPL